ncbi:MAG: hypothetical protein JNK57_02430 [Planctomycetaceae bacterium]|nr:hypothetical protein [Planctomycetaceae bacterium]
MAVGQGLSVTCPPTGHPQFGFAVRGNYQTHGFCRPAAQAIRCLRPLDVSADSTIGVLGLTSIGLSPIEKLFRDDS